RSFVENEVAAVKKINPDIPVTTNFQHLWDMDYSVLANQLDVISWDNYPLWHSEENEFTTAADSAMFHSLFNSLKKDRPFMLMESSPSATCWQDVSKLRRPGMHLAASMQAVAHGSDTVQYFQWRKSRGQVEQFHGAVVGHDNSDDTRIFKEVAEVGSTLKKISEVTGSLTKNEVAILFDYDSLWSLCIAEAYRNMDDDKGFEKILVKNFGALWQLNIGCDFVFANEDFSNYKVIVAPMLFMLKEGVKEKIEDFVRNGGIFVSTFISGIVDEDGMTFFDEECYPFRKLLGVKAEETDSLYDGQCNHVSLLGNTYKCEKYCELAYTEGAEVLGEYLEDFHKGFPAVTANSFGKGKAYYIACDLETDGYIALYKELLSGVISSDKVIDTPENVSVTMRYSEDAKYVFIMNFNNKEKELQLPFNYELLSGELVNNIIKPYGVVVLKTAL
ncbi:MAG: beta-galactosidase trimerization domain-containing protein, partial [Oscillospiraceae bacterium]|nr:beta-galactosidase trimerization domain-containing protein [Oscillospiraceae bacterium]